MLPAAPEGLAEAGEHPARPEGLAEDLAARVAASTERVLELRGLLRSAHEQLARRDDEIARLMAATSPATRPRASRSTDGGEAESAGDPERAALDREIEVLRAQLERERGESKEAIGRLQGECDRLQEECRSLRDIISEDAERMRGILGTRAWRIARAWWQLKDAFRER